MSRPWKHDVVAKGAVRSFLNEEADFATYWCDLTSRPMLLGIGCLALGAACIVQAINGHNLDELWFSLYAVPLVAVGLRRLRRVRHTTSFSMTFGVGVGLFGALSTNTDHPFTAWLWNGVCLAVAYGVAFGMERLHPAQPATTSEPPAGTTEPVGP